MEILRIYLEENNKEDPKFEVGDHVTISKYKKKTAKFYTPNWSEEVFATKKVKNIVSWTYVTLNDLRKRIAKNKSKRVEM